MRNLPHSLAPLAGLDSHKVLQDAEQQMDHDNPSRRQFMAAVGNLASAGWIALNWPDIAQAAQPMNHHGMHGGHAAPAGAALQRILTPAEEKEVEAIANQIVPGGKNPGAREAGAIDFINNALASFFGAQLPSFREGLVNFNKAYAAAYGAEQPFSAAPAAQQIAFLGTVDKTPFFQAVRRLTVLGLIALPKYGGNRNNLGWTLIGVEDNHMWAPPFGYYDQDYAGFEPYPGTKPYTADPA
jgi:hypothetical protein